MRTIIAGSRGVTEYWKVVEAIKESGIGITTVISGTARGVDRLGERYAKQNEIKLERYPADWGKYGKRAGFLRNAEMVSNAEALIAVWDGKSKGTKHTITLAKDQGLLVYVKEI